MSVDDLRHRWLASIAAAERAIALAAANGLLAPDDSARFGRSVAEHRDFVLRSL